MITSTSQGEVSHQVLQHIQESIAKGHLNEKVCISMMIMAMMMTITTTMMMMMMMKSGIQPYFNAILNCDGGAHLLSIGN